MERLVWAIEGSVIAMAAGAGALVAGFYFF